MGKHALRRMAEFGEDVVWLPEKWEGGRMEKLEPKFERGVWLRVCPQTDEASIGTPAGIVRAGTVKRGAIEDAWKASRVLSISTTPWTTGRQSKRHKLTVENDEGEKLIQVDGSELRRLRITKEDLEKIVFSDSCVGARTYGCQLVGLRVFGACVFLEQPFCVLFFGPLFGKLFWYT